MEELHKIKIHFITSPSFKVGDKIHHVEDIMLRNFADIDKLIDRYQRIAEKKGIKLEMAIFSVTNMHGDKPVVAYPNGGYIPFLRYKFFESFNDELPICEPIK